MEFTKYSNPLIIKETGLLRNVSYIMRKSVTFFRRGMNVEKIFCGDFQYHSITLFSTSGICSGSKRSSRNQYRLLETGEKINLGNDVADFLAYKRAVEYVTKKGSLVVVAAGNESLNGTNKKEVMNYLNQEYAGDGLYFVGAGFEVPGSTAGVVTVSATGPKDVLANYSNYGPGFIDIAAVGGDARMYYQAQEEGWFT